MLFSSLAVICLAQFSNTRTAYCDALVGRLKGMVAEALEMESQVAGWRQGLIPFARDVDGTVLVCLRTLFDWLNHIVPHARMDIKVSLRAS